MHHFKDSRVYSLHLVIVMCIVYSLGALYKGLVPKVLRLGPGAGIMMIVYENVYSYLVNKFPDDWRFRL